MKHRTDWREEERLDAAERVRRLKLLDRAMRQPPTRPAGEVVKQRAA